MTDRSPLIPPGELYPMAIRAGLAKARQIVGSKAEHRHQDGPERCPICSNVERIEDAVVAEVAAAVENVRMLADPVLMGHTTRCGHCSDLKWVERTDGSTYPCRVCQPDVYEEWADGNFNPSWLRSRRKPAENADDPVPAPSPAVDEEGW